MAVAAVVSNIEDRPTCIGIYIPSMAQSFLPSILVVAATAANSQTAH